MIRSIFYAVIQPNVLVNTYWGNANKTSASSLEAKRDIAPALGNSKSKINCKPSKWTLTNIILKNLI